MLDRFTDQARRTLVKAGTLALDAGLPALTPDLMLFALMQTHAGRFPVSADDISLDIPDSRSLLATLGIDLDAVHRRTRQGTDDPARWRLTRSLLRPLRVTLYGPLGSVPLAMHTRKVVEVAMWRPGPVTGDRLLWGLLADYSNGVGQTLCSAGVDLSALVEAAGIPVKRGRGGG
jgi:hypothetical protein